MNPAWNSELPFYVVVQDVSSPIPPGEDPSTADFQAIDYNSVLGQPSAALLDLPANIYPDVRYRFLDDDEPVNAPTPDDTVIVLDMDARGSHVSGVRTLSSIWQAYAVRQQPGAEGTGSIIIQGTQSAVPPPEEKDEGDDNLGPLVEEVRGLVRLFNERNAQLAAMVGSRSE